MRKALLFASALTLTVAALAAKPAQAAASACGCWCGGAAYYSTYSCKLPNGSTTTCRSYYNNYC
jgi:hypothetical protein